MYNFNVILCLFMIIYSISIILQAHPPKSSELLILKKIKLINKIKLHNQNNTKMCSLLLKTICVYSFFPLQAICYQYIF